MAQLSALSQAAGREVRVSEHESTILIGGIIFGGKLASNQSESDKSTTQDRQDRPAVSNGEHRAATYPSQTLPLITEELAATHARTDRSNSTPSTTPHVTTPVMPPNPIRRDEAQTAANYSTQQQSTPAQSSADGPNETASTIAGPVAEALDDQGEKQEKKSEGKISATQLIAGAGAAATSSIIGGQLGVAGTVVGAGVASIITGLAVTLYSRSLDKGKEKIKQLAPAVKAKSAKTIVIGARDATGTGSAAGTGASAADRAIGTFGLPADDNLGDGRGSGAVAGSGVDTDADDVASATNHEEPKTWWQKLRRKRVMYPVAIGVATFGIGLGAVVMAESVTSSDISPGTSQISRSVTGNSGTGDESGTGQDGSSESSSSSSGSHSGESANQGSGTENSTSSQGESASASESSTDSSASTGQSGTAQGTDASDGTTTGSNSDSSSTSSGSSASGSSDSSTTGGADSSSASSGGSGSSSSSAGGSGSGSSGSGGGTNSGGSGSSAGSGSASSGSGSAATAQG